MPYSAYTSRVMVFPVRVFTNICILQQWDKTAHQQLQLVREFGKGSKMLCYRLMGVILKVSMQLSYNSTIPPRALT